MHRTWWTVCVLLLPVATAQAPAPDVEEGTWPTLQVPAPHAGDRLVYERSVVRYDRGEVEVVEAARVRERILLEQSGVSHDAWGVAHDAMTFVQDLVTEPTPTVFVLDRSTGTELSHVYHLGDEGMSDGTSYSWTTAIRSFWAEPERRPLCGLHNDLQGTSGPAPQEAALFRYDCRGTYWAFEGGATWRLDRVDGEGPERTVAYRQEGAESVALAWFKDGIPYPVRFLEEHNGGRFAVLDLVAFQRGDVAPARPVLVDLPPVSLRTIRPLDPGPMGTAWPLEEALDAARRETSVRIYLDEHPDAYLRTALFNEIHHRAETPLGHREQTTHLWSLSLDDGRDAIALDVERTQAVEWVETPVGPQAVDNENDVDVAVRDVPSQGTPWSSLPHMLPSPESARLRWEAFAAPDAGDRGANAYGHTLLCSPCLAPRGATIAGHLSGTTWNNATLFASGEAGGDWMGSYLFLDHEGRVESAVENRNRVRVERVAWAMVPPLPSTVATPLEEILSDLVSGRRPGIPDVPWIEAMDEDGAPPRASEGNVEVRAATVQGAPEPDPWMVVSAVGGAVGLGLLWKFVGAALFSRIRRDKALRHPVRAHLMELVEAQPGIHLMELVRRSERPQGTVRHHIEKLVATGLVEMRRSPAGVAYFPPGTGVQAKRAAQVLRTASARRVASAWAETPGASPTDLARRTGLSPRTVRYHLRRLRDHGAL